MTDRDVIEDLTDMIVAAVKARQKQRQETDPEDQFGIRALIGEVDGLLLVYEWLRSHPSITEEA
jgi:hypothetical protein